ncbi:MBL fold metallo-hydrolase [Isoptericola hypogeus]|uniref:MBL fold metallo-hydrolase n=1 Tax=Isoptericola hypogeus TaxID=300179 RepID=A0ABN2JCY3_9MICO
MKLTKYAHACVVVEDERGAVLVDPGAFTPNAAELVASVRAVLVTHEHFDHVDVGVLDDALGRRDDLHVYGPGTVVDRWVEGHSDRVHRVRPGDRFTAGGLPVAAFGGQHAAIHADVPRVDNVGYLVGGTVFHPGDAYLVPDERVSTLLVPTSGPWTKLGDAVDYVRAVDPDRIVQIHEVMLSDLGQASVSRFLSPEQLSKVALTVLPAGASIDV